MSNLEAPKVVETSEGSPPSAAATAAAAAAAVAAGTFRMTEGDWVCSDGQCGNINFARRTVCNRCNKEKCDLASKKKLGSEIGKAAAEKSRGLFSAEDWQCTKCGNVNWARRPTCNMCNAPKFVEVEERTGFGGGYNDRGVVEYKERDDSDNDYDEFGRRKKKKGKNDSTSSDEYQSDNRNIITPKLSRSQEEDEEDDDDEDEDLSKYELWGDDDEDNGGDDKICKEPPSPPIINSIRNSKKRTKSRSRSRSRSPIRLNAHSSSRKSYKYR